MKNYLLWVLLLSPLFTNAQSLRYFSFATECGHGNWQDTSFVAATSDQVLIDSVLANINRPYEERKFISGPINYGNGGHNRNASHWFLWHFVPDEWSLVEAAIEVCDGCPYTDLDSDTAYWVRTIGYYCPWTGKPIREISAPTGLDDRLELQVALFPNPSSGAITLRMGAIPGVKARLFSATGQEMVNLGQVSDGKVFSLDGYAPGLYFVRFSDGRKNKTLPLILGGYSALR